MGDPQTHHAHGHLRHLIGVWVVHEGSRPARHKLVHKGLSHRDLFLVQTANTVHAIGQALAVPMHSGVLRQFVRHKNPHLVTLDHLNGRAGALAVVTPHVDDKARGHFAHHRLSHQMELFHPVLHAKRQGPAVQGDHGSVGASGPGHTRGRPGWGGVGMGLNDGFGQSGQRAAADGGGGDSCPRHGACGGHRFLEKISALHGQCPAVRVLEGLAVSVALALSE